MSDRTVWRLEAENERLRDEVSRLRLTDAEREAVEFFAELPWATESGNAAEAAVLRGLLERLK